ncbi:MAG: hypothetical protein AAGL34_08935 [Bacteroidota bacterium]
MYIDKLTAYFDIQVGYQFKYYPDLDVFLWTIEQTLAVLVLIVANLFRPFKWTYLGPFMVFSSQLALVWRDEEWILHEYFYLFTIIFMVTVLVLVLLVKFAFRQISKLLKSEKNQSVEELVNFVVEVHNHHFAEILKSADALELLDETSISNEEREILKQLYRNDRKKAIRNFEVRIIETIYNIDKPNKRVKGFLNTLVVGVRNLFK